MPGQDIDLRNKRSRAREERRIRQQRRKRRRRILFGTVAGFFALAIITSFAISGLEPPQPGNNQSPEDLPTGPGMPMPIQGAQAISADAEHPPYNSLPPTSGWHYEELVAPWGIIKTQIPNEIQVHNLEHGGVLIQYSTKDTELISKLEEHAKRQYEFPCYVIVAPYQDGPQGVPIILTAWGAIQFLYEYEETTIQTFIDSYLNQGPEKVACGTTIGSHPVTWSIWTP